VTRLIGAGGGVIFKGGAPGQNERRQREDALMFEKAKIARRLKGHGKVPMNAQIKARDVDLSHHKNNTANLPPLAKRQPTTHLPTPQGE
jgi:hypothetical protein